MIVVTGMHRSGTSLAALVLREFGVNFGPEDAMYAADDWNAHGYLERADVVDLNSRALTGFNRTTGRPAMIASQASYLVSATVPQVAARRLANHDHLQDGFISNHDSLRDLAVKDPRFCLTLGVWQHYGSVDGLVVALRHPSEAVASLQRRNKLPPAIGHRFWRWHMEAVLPHIGPETLVLRQDHMVGEESDAVFSRAHEWLVQRGLRPSGNPANVVDRSLVHHRANELAAPKESIELWNRLISKECFGSRAPRATKS